MTLKQRTAQTAAAAKREARAEAHKAMQARHAARRAATDLYEAAFIAWEIAGNVGPAPLDPRFYDMALFPENKPLAA